MRQFTIGRLMLVVAVAAALLSVLRVVGLVPGVLVCVWATLSGLAWLAARRWVEVVVYWFGFQAVGVVLVSLLAAAVFRSWVGGLAAAGTLLVFLYPIHVGCGFGWMSAIRRANRTAPVPASTGPAWAYLLTPVAGIAASYSALLVLYLNR